MPHRAGVRLTKVFLALRTDFIPGLPTEHITLQYFDEVYWWKLVKSAIEFDEKLPATIVLKEAMEWQSFTDSQKYTGYSVHSPDSPILDHLSMPHITVPKHLIDTEPQRDVDVIDRLWLGKRIDGHLTWMRVSNKQLGIYYGT